MSNLTAHYREPLSTMERRPIPPHIAAQGPCGQCRSSDPARWRVHRIDGTWMCECFWFPERRPHYQPAPRAEKPKQTPLLMPAPGAVMFMCNLKARPGNRCHAVVHGDEAWWTNI